MGVSCVGCRDAQTDQVGRAIELFLTNDCKHYTICIGPVSCWLRKAALASDEQPSFSCTKRFSASKLRAARRWSVCPRRNESGRFSAAKRRAVKWYLVLDHDSISWRIACRLILLLVAGAAGLGAFYKMILKDVEFSKLSSLQLSLPWSSAFNLTTVAEKPEGSSWSWTSVADKLQGSGSASNGSTPEELRGAESADSFQNRSMVGEVPTEEILEGPGILVASGVPAKSPFKASDDMPHWKEVVPVFVEPILMNRSNFRMVELQKGGWTVEDPMQAVFYLVCCGPVERLLALPTRPPERPYFCYDCDAILHLESCSSTMGCLKNLSVLLARRDFLFSSSDLRWWHLKNDSALLMPGVTHAHPIPPPERLVKAKKDMKRTDPPKYFLTFQGTRNNGLQGSCYVRHNLEAAFNSSFKPPTLLRTANGRTKPLPTNFQPPPDVFVSIAGEHDAMKERRDYHSLFNSAYSLILHGHGRWSYRLMEALNGGAIPVIMADGWRLPFDELVDWEQISVQRPESMSETPEELIESLTRNATSIKATKQRIDLVYQKLMISQEIRLLSLLRSAAVWKQNWQENEQQTLRMLVDSTNALQRTKSQSAEKTPNSSLVADGY
ncbi:unnamed protein product [Durusdinium trenchii]|uniref:Exostosin GT47 domain-containing protein n=1 Tax=Durusdinium trenchii TaxID=1381693 RepID=A0ABP0I798_9DINO